MPPEVPLEPESVREGYLWKEDDTRSLRRLWASCYAVLTRDGMLNLFDASDDCAPSVPPSQSVLLAGGSVRTPNRRRPGRNAFRIDLADGGKVILAADSVAVVQGWVSCRLSQGLNLMAPASLHDLTLRAARFT